MPGIKNPRERKLPVLLHHATVIGLVRDNAFIPRIRKLFRVLIPSGKSSGLPSEPIAAVVSVTVHHGYFDVVLEYVFEFGDGAAEAVAGAGVGAGKGEGVVG